MHDCCTTCHDIWDKHTGCKIFTFADLFLSEEVSQNVRAKFWCTINSTTTRSWRSCCVCVLSSITMLIVDYYSWLSTVKQWCLLAARLASMIRMIRMTDIQVYKQDRTWNFVCGLYKHLFRWNAKIFRPKLRYDLFYYFYRQVHMDPSAMIPIYNPQVPPPNYTVQVPAPVPVPVQQPQSMGPPPAGLLPPQVTVPATPSLTNIPPPTTLASRPISHSEGCEFYSY